jgi:hypothetical protein
VIEQPDTILVDLLHLLAQVGRGHRLYGRLIPSDHPFLANHLHAREVGVPSDVIGVGLGVDKVADRSELVGDSFAPAHGVNGLLRRVD